LVVRRIETIVAKMPVLYYVLDIHFSGRDDFISA
jgi:hypothetical protein